MPEGIERENSTNFQLELASKTVQISQIQEYRARPSHIYDDRLLPKNNRSSSKNNRLVATETAGRFNIPLVSPIFQCVSPAPILQLREQLCTHSIKINKIKRGFL